MQLFSVKRFCRMGLLAGLIIIMGCGSGGDPIDESGYRYQIITASIEDRNAVTSDIDVWRDCDNDYDNGADDEDLLTKASVTLSFESSDEQPDDIWVYRLRIEYELIEWNSGPAGDPANIPAIPTNTYDVDIFIPRAGGSSSDEVDLFTLVDKSNYRTLLGLNNAGLQTRAAFQIKVTAFLTYTPQSPETHLEITKSFTINVQNFADSSCTPEEET